MAPELTSKEKAWLFPFSFSLTLHPEDVHRVKAVPLCQVISDDFAHVKSHLTLFLTNAKTSYW